MQIHRDLIELARICREQPRATKDPDVAAELRLMAREYQKRASKLNARNVPALDHSEDPPPSDNRSHDQLIQINVATQTDS